MGEAKNPGPDQAKAKGQEAKQFFMEKYGDKTQAIYDEIKRNFGADGVQKMFEGLGGLTHKKEEGSSPEPKAKGKAIAKPKAKGEDKESTEEKGRESR